MKAVVAYVPVPHAYYRRFFAENRDADEVYLFGTELISEFPHLRKNVPALQPDEIQWGITAMGWVSEPPEIADLQALHRLNRLYAAVTMPDEDVSHAITEKYLPNCTLTYYRNFLRWDKSATLAQSDPVPDVMVSSDDFDRHVLMLLDQEKERSLDFWRQVAAAIVRDGRVIMVGHNQHVPTEQNPLYFGDPRFNFSRGVAVELGTADHAEQVLISLCARDGTSTLGADIYATTFPCAWCAKAIGRAGFARCFFRTGYTSVDAETVLRAYGVQLVQVK